MAKHITDHIIVILHYYYTISLKYLFRHMSTSKAQHDPVKSPKTIPTLNTTTHKP